MSINELQDEVIAEFSDFDDWMDRYQLLIDRKSTRLNSSHRSQSRMPSSA